MDRETLMMLMDPRSPLKGRSPIPLRTADTQVEKETDGNNTIIPKRITFDDTNEELDDKIIVNDSKVTEE